LSGIFVGREFLSGFFGVFGAGIFGGFWDFWRLGVFGVFVGLVVLRVESVLERQCYDIDVVTLTIEAVLVVWFGH
jgi:hypothetical protein